MTITGGLLTVAASGGTLLPVALGVVATAGGSTKFYFDAKGDYAKSEATPTTISGTVIVTANYMVGEEVFSQSFKSTVSFVEGVATLDLKNLKIPNLTKNANEVVSMLNLSIDATSIPENLENVLAPKDFSSPPQQNQKATPTDATNVVTTPVLEFKPLADKKSTGSQKKVTTKTELGE